MILKDVELEFTQASHLAGENYREIVEIAATAPDETRRFVGGLHGSLKTGTTHNETTAWTPTPLPSLLTTNGLGCLPTISPGRPSTECSRGGRSGPRAPRRRAGVADICE